jgi:V8-like Glu-specific endopeptidase
VRAVLDRLAPFNGQRYVDGHKAIRDLHEYTILTARGAKTAQYVRGWASSEQVAVQYGSFGSLRQRVLVIESSLTTDHTAPGDSGAPIVTKDRTQLVGMHFAGVNETSYMIPAYELVQRRNYIGFASGEPFVID